MNRSEIIDVFKETGALLDGHFILTSGRHSFSYFQCARVLQHPEYLTHFAEMIAKHFNKEKISGVGVMVDRSNGSIALHPNQFSIIAMEAKSYGPNEVPESLSAIPVQKPGSRETV